MAESSPMRVVVVGGGVAALEAALALHDLAGDRVALTLVAPNDAFVYRPLTVGEPFGFARASRYPLARLAASVAAELITDRLGWIDAGERRLHTDGDHSIDYDALLLAPGARLRAPFAHATTMDDSRMDELLHGLVQDIEEGYVRSIALVSPTRLAYPLPLYELALLTAARAYEMQTEVTITVVTPEKAPLAIAGAQASGALARLLDEHGVALVTSADAQVPEAGEVMINGGQQTLRAERIVAMPALFGPAVRGLRSDGEGFLSVDSYARLRDAEHVWAAGDATDFPVKHGGVAAQQADVAALSIAALAGAPVEPIRFDPEIRGALLTGRKPLYFISHLSGSTGFTAEVSETPLWTPVAKIAATYLAPYLDAAAPTR